MTRRHESVTDFRMISLQTILGKRHQILDLADKHRAANIRIFGSVARADNSQESDVDFLIQTKPGCSLLDLGGLLQDLRDLLDCPVDLVTEDGLKPAFKERVLREAVPI